MRPAIIWHVQPEEPRWTVETDWLAMDDGKIDRAALIQGPGAGRRWPRLRPVLVLAVAMVATAGAVTGCTQAASGHSASPSASGRPVSASSSPPPVAGQPASQPGEYSHPQFCIHQVRGFPCLSVIDGNTATGAGIQVSWHTVSGNPGSTFMAMGTRPEKVASDSPFGDPAIDQAYAGWHVVEFEATPDGRLSGQCISTLDSAARHDARGNPYYLVRLVRCDPSNDDNSTWAVWNHNGSPGHPIIMVALTNATGSLQRLSCVMNGLTGHCAASALVAAASAGPTIRWAHFSLAG